MTFTHSIANIWIWIITIEIDTLLRKSLFKRGVVVAKKDLQPPPAIASILKLGAYFQSGIKVNISLRFYYENFVDEKRVYFFYFEFNCMLRERNVGSIIKTSKQ